MNKNEKTFRLVNKISQSFSIIVTNFQYAATLITNIRLKLNLTFVPLLQMKLVTVMRLRKIRMTISTMKLIANMVQTISSRRINILTTLRQSMKAVVIIYVRQPITFVSKARQKLVSIISNGKLTLDATPNLVQLFLLGYFDPDTLGDWDASTLGAMDYTVV